MAQVKVNYRKLNGTPVKLYENTAFEEESQAHFKLEHFMKYILCRRSDLDNARC